MSNATTVAARLGVNRPRARVANRCPAGSWRRRPLPRSAGRDFRALAVVVPSLVFLARRAAGQTVKGPFMKVVGNVGYLGAD
jgi:hypothetical protein